MNATITRTEHSIVVVVDGDITPEQWYTLCAVHGLRGRHVHVEDYTTDGHRHTWRFTLLPHVTPVEVTQ